MTTSITIYHSPDSDDAFMFYGFQAGAVKVEGYVFNHELKDIESLNQMAMRGEIDTSAASVHACAYLQENYAILRCGASMGGATYGPKLVARSRFSLNQLEPDSRIAVPGELTSSTLAVRMFLADAGLHPIIEILPFDQIQHAVAEGEVSCGVIIHEGQLNFEKLGLVSLCDLGEWWWRRTELPLPLGVNIVNRRLGESGMRAVASALRQSIDFALANRSEALDYALSYGRGISREEADKFVSWYVNDLTRDMGERGVSSIKRFLEEGYQRGFLKIEPRIEFVG